jgi:hypothetical protein
MVRDAQLGVRITSELRERLEARARDDRRTLSQTVEILLTDALDALDASKKKETDPPKKSRRKSQQ